MGEFTQFCEEEFPPRSFSAGAEELREATVQRVYLTAKRITANQAFTPSEAGVRALVSVMGCSWRSGNNTPHFELTSLGLNVNRCFSRERACFPDMSEQPILTAMSIELRDTWIIAENGLTRFPNVDAGKVAIELGLQFAKDQNPSEDDPKDNENYYPFLNGPLSNLLPEQKVRARFIKDSLEATFSVYELNPVEGAKWRMQRGQNIIGSLLRYPSDLPPATLMTVLEYATKYGCPGLAHALEAVANRPELIEHSPIPHVSAQALEDTVQRYQDDYGMYRRYPAEDVIRMLPRIPPVDQMRLIKLALPDLVTVAEIELLVQMSAVDPEELYLTALDTPWPKMPLRTRLEPLAREVLQQPTIRDDALRLALQRADRWDDAKAMRAALVEARQEIARLRS